MSIVTSAAALLRFAEDEQAFNPDIVSPGVAGFVVTALIALAVILLGTDLVRRLRRGRYREEIRQSLQAELDERDAAERAARGDAPVDAAPEADLGDPPRG